MASTTGIEAVIAALLGAAFLLAGYRIMRVSVRVFAAILFSVLGLVLAAHFSEALSGLGSAQGAVTIGGVITLAVVGYLLGDAFYFLYVVLVGALAGFVLSTAVHSLAGGQEINWVISIGGAVVGGILGFFLEKPIGIFATSVNGAGLVAGALQGLIGGSQLVHIIVFAGLAIAGCWIQAVTTKKLPPKGKEGEASRKR